MKADGIQGCGAWYSYAYFISFQIVVSMILMNLSIAAVINALTEASNSENKNIKEEYIDGLIQVWAQYDPKATGFVTTDDLVCILSELPPPMGTGYDRYNEEKRMIMEEFEPTIIPDLRHTMRIENGVSSVSIRAKFEKVFSIPSKDEEHLWVANHKSVIYIDKNIAYQTLMQIDIPLYDNFKVHFVDVSRYLANKALPVKINSENKTDQRINKIVNKQIKKSSRNLIGRKRQ